MNNERLKFYIGSTNVLYATYVMNEFEICKHLWVKSGFVVVRACAQWIGVLWFTHTKLDAVQMLPGRFDWAQLASALTLSCVCRVEVDLVKP